MLTPPFVFPAAEACPRPPMVAPVRASGQPAQVAVGPDGAAQLLLSDAYSVCWWTLSEDGDARLRAVWPLPGPHPVALAATEAGVVMAGLTEDGWAVTVVGEGARPRDYAVGGRGALARFEVDEEGRFARLAFAEVGGRLVYRRVDLWTGVIEELAARLSVTEVAHASR